MRKSNAPSEKNNPTSKINISAINHNASESQHCKANKCSQNDVRNNKEVFNVVYGRRSTKMHKTFENDGHLEIRNKIAFLKDDNNKVIGSISIKKEELFEVGAKLIIGSNEVEIIEKSLPTHYSKKPTRTQDVDENSDEPERKKKKPLGIFVPNLQLSAFPKNKKQSVNLNFNQTKDQSITNGIKPLISVNSVTMDELVLTTPSHINQLECNTKTKTTIEVKVSPHLAAVLRPHQREGVNFLYECLLGFRNNGYYGAILADEMGLGKTLQCLTVCHTLLKSGPFGGDRILKRVLIVTPSSLIENWNKEVNKWLGSERMFTYVVDSKHKIKNYLKQNHIPFVIASYETMVVNANDFESISFDLLICDEGHRLKSNQIKASICLQQLNIQRRLILTGTPLQNDLEEFFYLVDFVNPGILGTYQEYKFLYETTICRSQQPDADENSKSLGLQRANELKGLTDKFILRRTQKLNQEYLPSKREYIVFLEPSELQKLMIKNCIEWYKKQTNDDNSSRKDCNHLQIIRILQKICNHPSLLTCTESESSIINFLSKLLPSWKNMGTFDSAKMELLQHFLEAVTLLNEKMVIVSNSTKTLDMIQVFLDFHKYTYLRLDGQTPTAERQALIEKFNKEQNQYQIFLLSAKAGGQGINLCGASRLILFDNDWNPSVDLQAMSRIWRDGQSKNVKIYRLITAGTIEEKIFQRQIAKTNLGNCVIGSSSNQSIKLSDKELKDIFSFAEDFKFSTHESLLCNCNGSGKVKMYDDNINDCDEIEDPYRISLTYSEEKQIGSELNELMKWEHYGQPIDADFLKESSLHSTTANIVFIFSNLV